MNRDTKQFKTWLLGECANSCSTNKINEADTNDIEQAQEIVGGEIVDGKGLQFSTKEEVANAKKQLTDNGIASYFGNRNPFVLFIGKADVTTGGRYGMGPFAAEVIKGVENNPSAKAELDKLVKEKGYEVQDTYTGADLESIFNRMELKKYSKSIPAIPNIETGEVEIDRMEQDQKTIEFIQMFPDFDNAVDLVLSKFKAGENVCPYVRTFLKREWLGNKNDVLNTAKANGLPNLKELEIQLENC